MSTATLRNGTRPFMDYAAPYPDSSATYDSTQRGFTRSEDGRWDFGRRTGSPTSYNDRSYPSASAALEAYIIDHGGEERWRIKTRYARDVEDLLISRCKDNMTGAEDSPGSSRAVIASQEDLRRHLAIKRLVDESYEKLECQQVEPHADYRSTSAGDRLPLVSEDVGFAPHNVGVAMASGSVSSSDSVSRRYDDPAVHRPVTMATHTSGSGTSSYLNNRHPDDTWRQKLLSHSQLEGIKSRLRNNELGPNGYHGNLTSSSVNCGGQDKMTYGSDSGQTTSHWQPDYSGQSSYSRSVHDKEPIRSGLETGSGDAYRHRETHSRRCASPLLSQPFPDPDDTMTQLMSSRKAYSVANIPSWVEDLDATGTGHPGDNSTILTGLGQRPLSAHNKAVSTPVLPTRSQSATRTMAVPSAPLLTTPKKQLRFDLDLSQSTLNTTKTEDQAEPLLTLRSAETGDIQPSMASERLSLYANGLSLTSPKAGILKSPSRRDKSKSHDVSFTTEDISLGTMQFQRKRDFREKSRSGHHLRSFSASGRLSSTPVKAGLGASAVLEDRPYIGEISSVHAASSGPSSVTSDAPPPPPPPPKYQYRERAVKYDPVLDLYKVNNEKVAPHDTIGNGTRAPSHHKGAVCMNTSAKLDQSAADVAYARYCSKYRPLPPDSDSNAVKQDRGPVMLHTTDVVKSKPGSRSDCADGYFIKSSQTSAETSKASSQPLVSRTTQPVAISASHSANSMATVAPSHVSAGSGIKQPSAQVQVSTATGTPAHDDMSSTHKQYLQGLVRDIEDGSSTVVTGLTELQELLSPLGLPWGPDFVSDGLRTPSEASDPPLRASGLEEGPDSDIILDGDRSWEKYVNRPSVYQQKMAAASDSKCPEFHHKKGGIVEKFLRECHELQTETEKVLNSSLLDTSKKLEPHGTMEALKNMLFTMQSMTTSPNDLLHWPPGGGTAGQTDTANSVDRNLTASGKPESGRPDDGLSPSTKRLLESDRGGDSLERALMHLNRLKTMVKGHKEEHP